MFTDGIFNKTKVYSAMAAAMLLSLLVAGCGGGGPSVTDSANDTIIQNGNNPGGNQQQDGGSSLPDTSLGDLGGYLFPFVPAITFPPTETYRDASSGADDRLTRWIKNSYESLPSETGPSGVYQNSSLKAWGDQILSGINAERSKLGLAQLSLEPHLVASAQAQARDMALRDYFAHDTPEGMTIWDRFTALRFPYYDHAGENAAKGQESVAEVVSGWLNSEKHRKNMLDPNYRFAGIGVYFDSSDKTYPVHIIADFADFSHGLNVDWYQRGEVYYGKP